MLPCQSTLTDIKPALAGDAAKLAAMLSRAFVNDPAMTFIFPSLAERERRLPKLFRQLVASDYETGLVFMTAGGEAAALWRRPGCVKMPLLQTLRRAWPYLTALGPSLGRALTLSHAIESHMPSGEFWYLHVAGCDPLVQGKGFGSAAIRAGLEQAVGSRRCYLETGTARNLGFYNALGFEVTASWSVPGGPQFWSMLRG